MASYASGVDEVIDSVEQLREDGLPAAVIEIRESALRSLMAAMEPERIAGPFAGHPLQGLRRSQTGTPRTGRQTVPRRTARRLHVFFGAISRYADILVPKGMEAYRKLAEVEWEKVPARTPNDGAPEWGTTSELRRLWAEHGVPLSATSLDDKAPEA